MQLLEAKNIKKYYGDKLILKIDELIIYEGDRIGIVGANGAGKTTLLQILSGQIQVEEGFVKRHCNITYLKQFENEHLTADAKLLKEFKVTNKLSSKNISGGENTRLKLAKAFSSNNPIILADEPTSNLDIKGINLLKKKLSTIPTMLLISHDRDLLDSLCNKIIEIKDSKIKVYMGNYSEYDVQCKLEFQTQMTEYEEYKLEKKRLEKIYTSKKKKAEDIAKKPKNLTPRECRLKNFLASRPYDVKQKAMNSSANAVLSRIKNLPKKEQPKELPKIKLDFSLTTPPHNKIIISGESITFSYSEKCIFDNTSFNIKNGRRIAIVGENGIGKTTLLNLIIKEYAGIKVVPKATLGYFYQNFANLNFNKTVIENVMEDSIQNETTARTILARLLFASNDIKKKVEVLSGGERIKVAFAKLFVSDANVLLLDEPTNYLDMPSIEALQDILSEYEGSLIFVSHDKHFVNAVANQLLIIENKKIKMFNGNLSDFENEKIVSKSNKNPNKLVLEMKLTEILSRLSIEKDSSQKLKLEAEYFDVKNELKKI